MLGSRGRPVIMRSTCAPPDHGASGVSSAATARSTPTLTLAATTCPPSRRRISATGRLSSSPPSTSRSPRNGTGGSSPGTEQLTRAQNHAGPRSWNSTRARVRLHDTQKYDVGRSSMARSPNIALRVRIVARPVRSDTKGIVRSFRPEPPTYARRDISSICRSSAPIAYCAARMAPMLVPPTMSMGTSASLSARITPMCAKARAPPPPSTRPQALPEMRRTRRSWSDGLPATR